MYIYVYIYIYIYIYAEGCTQEAARIDSAVAATLKPSSRYIYIYIYIYIFIYVYIYREREIYIHYVYIHIYIYVNTLRVARKKLLESTPPSLLRSSHRLAVSLSRSTSLEFLF